MKVLSECQVHQQSLSTSKRFVFETLIPAESLPWQAFVRCSGCGQERASARACSGCSRQLIFQRAADGRETALRPVQRRSVATGAAVVRLFLFFAFLGTFLSLLLRPFFFMASDIFSSGKQLCG